MQRLEQKQVNANELADKLEQGHWEGGTREQAATMLRQQQAEYYSLLVNHDKLYAKVVEQQAEIEALKTYKPNQTLECSFDLAGFKPPAKTLTDEEINQVAIDMGMFGDLSHDEIELCRNVLRKAQEK